MNPHGGRMSNLTLKQANTLIEKALEKVRAMKIKPLAVVVACSLAGSAASRSQSADVAALALYGGADREQRLAKGARAEGEITLYSSLVVDDLNALSAAFEKKYGVKLKFWRAGSEKVVQRIVTEARAGRFDFDVVETFVFEFESLHREK